MSTSVSTTCRDISELLPSAKLAVQLLLQECFKAGIKNIFITETYRSQER
ncbi:M15 family metallopeptidase domain-containing protein [Lysinibacillus xylanilyticus]